MAEDVRQNFGTTSAVTGWSSLNSSAISDAGTDTSGAVDLGAIAPFALSVAVALSLGTGATGLIEIHALWSDDAANFADTGNGALIGVLRGTASATVRKTFSVPVAARHLQFYLVNNSGGQINASGNGFDYTPVSVDQA